MVPGWYTGTMETTAATKPTLTTCTHEGQDCDRSCDPNDFTVDPRFEQLVDIVHDMAMIWGIPASDIIEALTASVNEGDQR